MRRLFRLRSLRGFALLMLLAALAACGKKGPVRPLEKPLPAAPPQVSLVQKGERLLLSWRSPELNQDGSALTDLARFRIYRMEYDPLDPCPECRDTSTLRHEVDLEFLVEVQRYDDTFYFWDDEILIGTGYRYRVTPVTRRGFEGAASTVQRSVIPPPLAPTQLSAEELDRLVRLHWTAPPESGLSEVIGYNVYRAEGQEPFLSAPVNPNLLDEPSFEDFGLLNNQSYRYAVRAVAKDAEGTTAEGAFSETVVAIPRAGR